MTLTMVCNFIPKGFYKEVASPLLLDVNLHYPDSMENSLTTNQFRQFFGGSEIVVAGRLNDSQADTFLIDVSAQMVRVSKNNFERKCTYDYGRTMVTQHLIQLNESHRCNLIYFCFHLAGGAFYGPGPGPC